MVRKNDSAGPLDGIADIVRNTSEIADYLPLLGVDDAGAGTLAVAAGGIKGLGHACKGDFGKAAASVGAGIVDGGVALLPMVEYLKVVGIDVRASARNWAENRLTGVFCRAAENDAPAEAAPHMRQADPARAKKGFTFGLN